MVSIKIIFTLISMGFATGNYYGADTKINDVETFDSKQAVHESDFETDVREDYQNTNESEESLTKRVCEDMAEPGCDAEVTQETYNESVEKPDGNEKKFLSDLETMSEDNLFDYLDGSSEGVANKKSAQEKKHL